MAKQTGLIKFTGKLGNVVGYCVDGEYYIRSAAEVVHQSEATKVSARNFGRASKLGAAMRRALCSVLSGPEDGGVVNRLNKTLLAVLQADDLRRTKRFVPRNFGSLQGFSLNPHAALNNVLTVTPAVDRDAAGNIVVTIPKMSVFKVNPRATHLRVKAMAVHVAKTCNQAAATVSDGVFIDISEPAPAITLTLPAGNGAVSCVLLEVTSWKEEGRRMVQLMNRLHNAADIIAVLRNKAKRRGRKRRTRITRQPLHGAPYLSADFFQRE